MNIYTISNAPLKSAHFVMVAAFAATESVLHLCTFKTPTKSAVMSEQGDADLWLRTLSATGAFIMRNGVNEKMCNTSLISDH